MMWIPCGFYVGFFPIGWPRRFSAHLQARMVQVEL